MTKACALCGLLLLTSLGPAVPSRAAPPAASAPAPRELRRPAYLRAGPALYHAVLESLPVGDELTVLQDGARWLKVRTAAGREGWVSARSFQAAPQPSGYGALLGKPGLPGVSAPVVTMASRALVPEGPDDLGAWALELALDASAPTAAEAELLGETPGGSAACARLAGLPEGDPSREAGERRLGLLLGARWLRGARLVTDPAAARYLGALGLRLADRSSRWDLGWSFGLVEDPAPRAIGLPGGLVLVTTGLVRGLPDEAALAAALGREVARVCRGQGGDELLARLAGPPPVPAAAALDEAALVLLAPAAPDAAELGARLAACAGLAPATPAARARFQTLLEHLPR